MNRLKSQRAFSLIEVVVSIALVGLVMVASLDTAGNATKTWLAASEEQLAHTLAQELMAEILAQPYSDPDTTNDPDLKDFGVEAGESTANRLDFDDLDDYDDWTASPPESRDGSAISAAAGWTRSVVVGKLKQKKVNDTHTDDGKNDGGTRLITVTVTDLAGAVTSLKSIRNRYGALEQPKGIQVEAVTNLSISLETGGGTVRGGGALLNHAGGP